MDDGIKQLGKNRWAIRVKRRAAATGRMVNRKATITGSRADARRVRDEMRAELAATQASRPRTRLSEYAASWLERRAASDLKPSVIRKYGYGLRHILPVLGDLYLDAISPADVAAYVAGRTGYTGLNELRLLRTIAKDSVGEGYAERDWCARVKPPRVVGWTRDRPNLLTVSQLAALVAAIPEQWRGLVLFLATTGLRWGEASALHWDDVRGGEARIRFSNDRGRLVTVKTTSSYRSVPVLPEVAALWGVPLAEGLVFPTRTGGLHRGCPLRRVLTEACVAAGIPRITTHGLRRTFNNLARPSCSREVLKSITGHATDAMTEHYSMIAPAEKALVSRGLAERIGVLPVSRASAPPAAKDAN